MPGHRRWLRSSPWAQAAAAFCSRPSPRSSAIELATNTGGKKIRVRMPRLEEGHIVVEDRKMFRVYPFRNHDGSTGEHRALIAEYTGNPNKTYLEMVERRGRFPSAQYRQCTSDLKRGPIERFIRSLEYKVVINCMGIRAEESRSARNCSRGR